jgi:hypothetical protein
VVRCFNTKIVPKIQRLLDQLDDSVSMYVKTGVRGKVRKSFAMNFEYQDRKRWARSPWINVDGTVEQSAKFGRKMTAARGRI